ncbi:MAG: hypothetical protein Q7S12_00075 [bacterium]|nr:hypothetical protein [bacterium]
MSKIFTSYLIAGILVMVFLLMPQNTFAAELTFKIIQNTETSDNATLVEVRIDPQSKSLNVVEGEIRFSGSVSDGLSVQVENGHSILPLWPTSPQYDTDKKSISFTGGVPGGFSSEELLFYLRLSPTLDGDLDILYVNGNAYLNDGKGTKETVFSKPIKIHIGEGQYQKVIGDFFSLIEIKYVIIILLIVAVLIIILKYGFKKKIKQ